MHDDFNASCQVTNRYPHHNSETMLTSGIQFGDSSPVILSTDILGSVMLSTVILNTPGQT